MNRCIKSMLFFFLLSGFVFAQDSLSIAQRDSAKIANLEKRIKALEEKQNESELQKLLSEAEEKSNEKPKEKKLKIFSSGQRSLQAINPEMSVVGDMFGQYVLNKNNFYGDNRTGAYFRTLSIHFQGGLDPFSFTKAAVEFNPDGVELAEAYITLTKFIPHVSFTAGKFRQQFGVLNRWHVHSLDQQDYPLALTTILGEDGLNQIGISFDWTMPAFTSDANELTLQITNGSNDNLFSGKMFSFPSALLHFKNYWDLSRNTYFELGFTGMLGENNLKGIDDSGNRILENARSTALAGADLTLFWEPVNQALYHSFIWRSEFYYGNKDLLNGRITAAGGYTNFEYRFAERWKGGTRFDYTQPFEENNNSKYEYQIVPYLTWEQSHWVRFRLQYNYLNGSEMPEAVNMLRLQIVWAVGPHKHDRY